MFSGNIKRTVIEIVLRAKASGPSGFTMISRLLARGLKALETKPAQEGLVLSELQLIRH
jgi:hypothetical protein